MNTKEINGFRWEVDEFGASICYFCNKEVGSVVYHDDGRLISYINRSDWPIGIFNNMEEAMNEVEVASMSIYRHIT